MRQPFLRFSSRTYLITLASAALALSLTATPSAAMDDGDDTLLHEVSGLIGIDGDKAPEIDYRDQAPLVLPPKGKTNLPAPKLAGGNVNPAWPKDPDVDRRRKAAAAAKMPTLYDAHRPEDMNQSRDARLASRVVPVEPVTLTSCRDRTCPPTQEQRDSLSKSLNGLTADKSTAIGQEPDRDWLTEPPKGYRKITQSVTAANESEAAEAKTKNPLAFWNWFSK